MTSNKTLTWIVIIVLAVLLLPGLLHFAFGMLIFSLAVVWMLIKLAALILLIALIVGVVRGMSR
jgi:hypothetical protein